MVNAPVTYSGATTDDKKLTTTGQKAISEKNKPMHNCIGNSGHHTNDIFSKV